MSHRGTNSNTFTIQTWNGTRWVPVNNLAVLDIGSDVFLAAPAENTAAKVAFNLNNVQFTTSGQLNLMGDVIVGPDAADAGPTSSSTSVVVGKQAVTSLAAPNQLDRSVVIGDQALRDNNSGVQNTTAIGYGIGALRGAPFSGDVLLGYAATLNDGGGNTERVIIGAGAASSGGGNACVVIGNNAMPIATNATTTVAIGKGIAPNLAGSSSVVLIGAGFNASATPFGGVTGIGGVIGVSVNGAFDTSSSLSGIHIGAASFNASSASPDGITVSISSFNSGSLASLSGLLAVVDSSFGSAVSVSSVTSFGRSVAPQATTVANAVLLGDNVFSQATTVQNTTAVGFNIDSPAASLNNVQLFGNTISVPTGITSDYSSFQNVLVRQGTTKVGIGPTIAAINSAINAQTASTAIYRGQPGSGVADSQAVLDLISQGASNTGNAGIFVGDRNPNTASMAATVGDLYVNSTSGQLWQCTVAGTPGTWVQFGTGGGTPNWSTVLAAGNTSGANNPTVTAGAYYTGDSTVTVRSTPEQANTVSIESGSRATAGTTGSAVLRSGGRSSGTNTVVSGGVSISTGDASLTGQIDIYTGQIFLAGQQSGQIRMFTGSATGSTGQIQIYTGNASGNVNGYNSGPVLIFSGTATRTTGNVHLGTGSSNNFDSGNAIVSTGSGNTASGSSRLGVGPCTTLQGIIDLNATDNSTWFVPSDTFNADVQPGSVHIRAKSKVAYGSDIVVRPGDGTNRANSGKFVVGSRSSPRFAVDANASPQAWAYVRWRPQIDGAGDFGIEYLQDRTVTLGSPTAAANVNGRDTTWFANPGSFTLPLTTDLIQYTRITVVANGVSAASPLTINAGVGDAFEIPNPVGGIQLVSSITLTVPTSSVTLVYRTNRWYVVGSKTGVQTGSSSSYSFISPAGDISPTVAELQQTENTYLMNTNAAARVVTLPSPAPANGTRVVIKDNGNAATNNITITTTANIDGSGADKLITTNFASVTLQSDGTGYWVI